MSKSSGSKVLEFNQLYLHEDCRDAAIMVLGVEHAGDDLLVNVQWWNVGSCHYPYPMGDIHEDIRIKAKDISKWKLISKQYRCPPRALETL